MSIAIKCDGCGRISDPPYAHWDNENLIPVGWGEAPDDDRFDWCPWCQVRYGFRQESDFPSLKFPASRQIVALNLEDDEAYHQALKILGLDKSRKVKPSAV